MLFDLKLIVILKWKLLLTMKYQNQFLDCGKMNVSNLLPLLEIGKLISTSKYLSLSQMDAICYNNLPLFQVNLDSDNGLTAVKRVDIMCFLKLWLEHPTKSL